MEFVSATDTEVISHLIASYYKGDLLSAIQQAVMLLKGAFAIALIHVDYPDYIFAVSHESPLAIGVGQGENFVASDSGAFAEYTKDVIFLANNEIARVSSKKIDVFNLTMEPLVKTVETIVANMRTCFERRLRALYP